MDDLDGDFVERPAGEAGDRVGREPRPAFGHVEAAVAREPGEQHVLEAEHRRQALVEM